MRGLKRSKWICTDKVENLDDDPFKNWQQNFRDGAEAERQIKSEDRWENTMLKKLTRYATGGNSQAQQFEMTNPMTIKRTKLARNRERQEMCLWPGSQWENRRLPEPLKDDVYIQDRDAMQVFVQ